jgi:L-malate glycosyltransferase
MLNICNIISGDLWAGAEVMAYHLLKGLRVYSSCDLSAIVLNNGKLSEEIKRLGIRTYVVEEKNLTFLAILLAVRKILHKNPPDIIHSHRYKENILSISALSSFRQFVHNKPSLFLPISALSTFR